MKDGPQRYTVVPHKDKTIACHLEIGPLLDNFGFPSANGPFMRDSLELGWSREVVDIFKIDLMKLVYIVFQVQDYIAYPIGFDQPPYAVNLSFIPYI